MNSTEATEVFFATTKLFQSNDISLRRLVYLAIKEMAKIADDVIIVTSRWRVTHTLSHSHTHSHTPLSHTHATHTHTHTQSDEGYDGQGGGIQS